MFHEAEHPLVLAYLVHSNRKCGCVPGALRRIATRRHGKCIGARSCPGASTTTTASAPTASTAAGCQAAESRQQYKHAKHRPPSTVACWNSQERQKGKYRATTGAGQASTQIVPVMFTEAGMAHVTGLIALAGLEVTEQLRFTIPINPSVGVMLIVDVSPVVAP